jgi:protein-S-isoprenylcysteine O-methyltransferase Ste14
MKLQKPFSVLMLVVFWFSLGALQLYVAVLHINSATGFIAAIHLLLFGYFVLYRKDDESKNPYPWYIQYPILLSIFLGNFFVTPNPIPWQGVVIGILGLSLCIWSTINLGTSIGIAPANRGLVEHGVYRIIRHPMYASYLISNLDAIIWNSSLWNWFLYFFIAATFVARILLEERVVSNYGEYKQKVRWRLIPFVW